MPGSYCPPLGAGALPITQDEQQFLDAAAAFAAQEGAYAALQSTKPQTLAFALTDSPLGLAAWIAEKVRAWSDCGGNVETVISLDTLLTNISLYLFSDSIAASLRLYKENRLNPLAFGPGERVTTPLGMAVFPCELPTPPRSWAERVFDVRRWTSMPAGGHFAALEQPSALAAEIRAFFRPLRGPGARHIKA
jgi:pimeloyl-ACP methyl ester carboxylesterase